MELRPTSRKESGWTENSKFLRRSSKNKNIKETPITPEEKFHPHDDIPVIPDLDEIKDEILFNEISEPPSVNINRSIALKELNSDLLSNSAFTSIEADFSILTSCIQHSSLDEPDELWEWDSLFTQVTADIHSDKNTLSKSKIAADEVN
ncbi:IFT43 family protein [Megaselia abdita]